MVWVWFCLFGQVSLFVCLFVSFVCLLDLCNLMFSGFIPLGSMARQILLMSNDRNAECVHRRCWWHEINSFINENSSKQTKVQLTWWIPSKSINQLLPFVTWNDNPNGRSPTTSEKVTFAPQKGQEESPGHFGALPFNIIIFEGEVKWHRPMIHLIWCDAMSYHLTSVGFRFEGLSFCSICQIWIPPKMISESQIIIGKLTKHLTRNMEWKQHVPVGMENRIWIILPTTEDGHSLWTCPYTWSVWFSTQRI